MPVLEIEGVGRVEVGDDFMQLSPEQQSQAVQEIATQGRPTMVREAVPGVPPIPEPVKPELAPVEPPGPVEGFMRGVAETATGGFLDELSGGVARAFVASPEEAEFVRQTSRQLTEASPPGARLAGNIAGGIGVGAALPVAGGGALARGAASMAEGAGLGALAGAGAAEEGERLEGAQQGALVGAAFGAAAPFISSAFGGVSRAFNRTVAPSLDQLRRAAQGFYQQADDIGLTVSQSSLVNAADDIVKGLREAGYSPRLHPKITGAVREIASAAETGPQSLRQLDILRRIAQSAGRSVEPDERRLGGILVDKIDDYLLNVGPQDVVAGNPAQATAALRQARRLWSRLKKGEEIEDLFARAEITAPNFSGSGRENALRTEFRALAKNAKKMRVYTPAEQAAIRRVAKGGPVTNSLRMLGKFAPTGVVSTALSGGTGAVIGGPIGAVGLPAAGFAARQAATLGTTRAARQASEMVRSGGLAQMPRNEVERLTRSLLLGQTPTIIGNR